MKASKLVWYLGIAAIVVSGGLNAWFIRETMHMVTIQVPKHTLEPYQVIQKSDLITREVSVQSLEPDTIAGGLVGKVTSMTIPQHDPVQRFEIAQQGSMAQVIQHLYTTHPNDAFAQIQVQNTGLAQTVQPGQHVNFFVNNTVFQNVWVLRVTNPNAQKKNTNGLSKAVKRFVSVNPPSTPSSGAVLTFLVGGPWSTVQTLMASGDARVVMGNATAPTQSYTLGSPPVQQNQSHTAKAGASHGK